MSGLTIWRGDDGMMRDGSSFEREPDQAGEYDATRAFVIRDMPPAEERTDSLTFDELRDANVDERLRSVFHPLTDWNALEWAGSACGEAGEFANLCKKLRRPESVSERKLAKELGDTIIYLDLAAARLGLSLEECVIYAFNIVSEQKGCNVRL